MPLNHVSISPEALDEMRNWAVDTIDEETTRAIYSGLGISGASGTITGFTWYENNEPFQVTTKRSFSPILEMINRQRDENSNHDKSWEKLFDQLANDYYKPEITTETIDTNLAKLTPQQRAFYLHGLSLMGMF